MIQSHKPTAENLFICGHIQCIETVKYDGHLLFKAKNLPEMKKDKVYIIKIGLNSIYHRFSKISASLNFGKHRKVSNYKRVNFFGTWRTS